MSIQKITQSEAASLGVSSLPNRPSAPSLYGGESMTASELRAAFDRLPLLVAERLNALIESTGLYVEEEEKETLAALIATGISEGHSLADLFAEVKNGAFADYLSLGDERTLSEALSAIESSLSLPDGFANLRSYIDAPSGRVEEGNPLPVSGNEVFRHTEELGERLSALIPPTNGEVKAGDPLPVSGDSVFKSLTRVASPLDSRLSAIEGAMEGMPFYFDSVSAADGRMSVPDGAMRYARLDSIGGYTRASKNLLKLKPNMELGEMHGVKYSTDENGYFCIDSGGKDTGVSAWIFPLGLIAFMPATATLSARYISGKATGGSDVPSPQLHFLGIDVPLPTASNSFTSTNDTACDEEGFIQAVGQFTNYKIALQIEEGTTATDYEPYFEGLKSAKVKEVKSYGKNLYDGETDITLDGTHDERVLCSLNTKGTTTFSFKRDGTYGNLSGIFKIVYEDGTHLTIGPNMLRTTHEKKIKHILLVNWALCVGRIYDIQLERGSAATDYSPYFCDTYTVPEEVQALDGYGEGINAEYKNSVDLATKIYKKSIYTMILDGSEDWTYMATLGSPYNYFAVKISEGSPFVMDAVISDKYPRIALSSSNTFVGMNVSASTVLNGDVITIRPERTEDHTIESFKALLADNPVTAKVARVTADLTDVSPYLSATPYIEVEQGGYLEAISEDGLPAILTVTYQIKNET